MLASDFVEDQSYSPCANALAFVHALAEGRKVSTLMPTLNFIQEVVSKSVIHSVVPWGFH